MANRVTRAGGAAVPVRRAPARARVLKSSWKKRLKTLFAFSFLLVEVVGAVALVAGLFIFWNYSQKLPAVEDISIDMRIPVATSIWSQDGVLLGKLEVENRRPIVLKDVPKHAINATIAIEDHRFFEHHGVDIQGIARSAWLNYRGNNLTRQGGSTLTQQLVRNLEQFGLTKEKTIERKLREALIAMRLEQVYTKQDILQLYLNNIYYGGGAYGIQAASKTFFGKSAGKLTLAEAALIAGLAQRPSEFSPYANRRASIRRRDQVLDRMLSYGYITQAQYKKAIREKPRIQPRRRQRNFDFKAPYFTTYVLNDLMKRYGVDFVYSGLRIITTLDWKQQQIAEETLRRGLENASGYGANQGALVAIDPKTGYIRAMVGGRSFHADQYNAVTQGKRQPGSTFKVFDYAAAFDTGAASLRSTFRDVPIPYPNDPKRRVVKNYGGGYSHGYIDCLSAIKRSTNTIAVQVAKKIGIRTVNEYAQRMGITTELAPYLPTALGASAVRPLDLCSAYTVFPQKGNRFVPMALVKVTDSEENLIEEHWPQQKTGILKPETAEQMDRALEAVVVSGTGTRARGTEANGIVENARGKTGTTNDNRDAWFAGYTPELATVIWVASVHRSKKEISYRAMPGATGGHLCAPMWHNFMVKAVPIQRTFRLMQQAGLSGVRTDPFAAEKSKAEAKQAALEEDAGEKRKSRKKREETEAAREEGAEAETEAPAGATGAQEPETADPSASQPSDLTERPRPEPALPSPARAAVAPPPVQPAGGLRTSIPSASATPLPPVRPAASRPPAPRPAEPEMRLVTLCIDTDRRANKYCDATKTTRMTARQIARLRVCRLHKPPPGEEED